MALNYGVRIVAHHQALETAPRMFGPTLPERCAAARRQGRSSIAGRFTSRWPDGDTERRCLLEIAALPTFISPFQWRLVAQLSNAYETRDVDLLEFGAAPRRRRPKRRGGSCSASRTIGRQRRLTPRARSKTARTFLGFSRFPAAQSSVEPDGSATVRWTDVRFTAAAPQHAGRSGSARTSSV